MSSKDQMGLTADFSPIAARYDATRDLPEDVLLAGYDRLIEGGLFPGRGTILDAGCGSGQLSLPLAARGYEIRGIDISQAMVAIAQSKAHPDWCARYWTGDVRDLPYTDGSFDAVIVSKLFQHIADWQAACRELIRVARPGAPVVQLNERGAFGNSVRRFFSRRADELGFPAHHLGLNPHTNAEITAFMASVGCEVIPVDMSDLRWEVAISYGEALARLRERLFAEFWRLPVEAYDRLLADTTAWVEAQPEGGETVERLRPYLVVEVFRTAPIG
jgi:SAM-dependent methyltransferase